MFPLNITVSLTNASFTGAVHLVPIAAVRILPWGATSGAEIQVDERQSR